MPKITWPLINLLYVQQVNHYVNTGLVQPAAFNPGPCAALPGSEAPSKAC